MLESQLRVVLVNTRNPLNIGAAARAMSNFGFSHLRLVQPYEIAFREARSAVGSSDILAKAEEYETVAAAVADCGLVVGTASADRRALRHPLHSLAQAGLALQKHSGPIALLFGSEKRGLSNEDLSYCNWLLRIPTSEQNPSMNLGQAVAVCLYELIREPAAGPTFSDSSPAVAEDLDRTSTILTQALLAKGYMTSEALPASEENVRRFVRRLNLSSADAQTLMGMLRHLIRD